MADDASINVFVPIINGEHATLPIRRGSVRFAVGRPDGLSSNSWKFWVQNGEAYLSCRDSFKEAKLSLHKSGRWRFGHTKAASDSKISLAAPSNRAWEVWDRPPPVLPNITAAFRLLFPTSEIAVRPDQRGSRLWRDVFFIDPAPPGKMVVVSVFITSNDVLLAHGSEPWIDLASFALPKGEQAQVVAHWEANGVWPGFAERAAEGGRQEAKAAGIVLPAESVAYYFGSNSDQSRFVMCVLLRPGG